MMNVFGEAHYPKETKDMRFGENCLYASGDVEEIIEIIRKKIIDHDEATALTFHVVARLKG